MSAGTRLPWAEAYAIAEIAAAALRPHVVRLKAVGSLRRRRPYVSDLELLVEPRMVAADLFGTMAPDVAPIRREMDQIGTWVKGGDRMMQVTDLLGRKGAQLDLYLVHPPAQWGSLLAVRTGPADLGKLCMILLGERGYGHDAGHAFKHGTRETVDTPTEESFFELAGISCLKPQHRDDQCAELLRDRDRQQQARRGHGAVR